MLENKVKITNETFIDEAGNEMPYVAYVMEMDSEEFRLVPKKKDKRLISYLLTKYDCLPKKNSVLEAVCKITQEQFRDVVKRRTVDYVAYNVELCGRVFRFNVREEDRELIKYLLEEKGFFIDDLEQDGEEEDD